MLVNKRFQEHPTTTDMTRSHSRLPILAMLLLAAACSSSPSATNDDDAGGGTTPQPKNPKKGFGIVINDTNGWYKKVVDLEVSWHYSWGANLPVTYPRGVEYVPMVWGAFNIAQSVTNTNTWAGQGRVKYLLGFNEPDGAEQANMTVQRAIDEWPKLMLANVPLGSPSPIHTTAQWLKDFMAEANARSYRVDFIALHWYKGPNADQFINEIQAACDLYQKPVWITEFGVADWGAASVSANRYTSAQVLAFMQNILPRLDAMPCVVRYAWFNSSPTHPALAPSALFNTDVTLTPLGTYYKNFR